MNDYDKAGRYLVKRDPAGFFRWLLANLRLSFQAWIDARRVALPDQNDLTNDLVAALRGGSAVEGMCLELEAEARADALTRLLEYLVRLWTEPGGPGSFSISCVSGAILDLTGRSPARELQLRSAIAHGCRLELTVLRRHLVDEQAVSLVADVAAGMISPWLLPWVPLMQGGGESAIIAQWRIEAERRLSDQCDRADLGSLSKTFATLAGRRPAWDQALRGWNLKTSPYLDEIRAEEARELILRMGRQKFGKAPTRKQLKTMEAITDLAQLRALAERLAKVDSWLELLGEVE
jgi:hypothetical protein